MQLSYQIVVFALSVARVHALPSLDHAAMSDRSVEALDDRKLSCNGELNFWNPHNAPKDTCQRMIASLYDNEVGEKTDHCFTDHEGDYNGSRCCVSWGKTAPEGTKYSDLKETAQGILDDCGFRSSTNSVSGKVKIANVNDECISVCLSSRPNGCNQECR